MWTYGLSAYCGSRRGHWSSKGNTNFRHVNYRYPRPRSLLTSITLFCFYSHRLEVSRVRATNKVTSVHGVWPKRWSRREYIRPLHLDSETVSRHGHWKTRENSCSRDTDLCKTKGISLLLGTNEVIFSLLCIESLDVKWVLRKVRLRVTFQNTGVFYCEVVDGNYCLLWLFGRDTEGCLCESLYHRLFWWSILYYR